MGEQGFVEVDGVRLFVRERAGEGPALVCLHAIGHDGADWDGLAARLPGRRVTAIDWPSQGRSGPDREPPSARRYQALASRVMDALGLDAAILVGNSIGAAAAIRLAAAEPGRVRALVLANPGGLDRGGLVLRVGVGLMVRFFGAGARGARWFGRAFALYYRMVLRQNAAASVRARIVADAYHLAPLLEAAWRGFGEPEADLRPLVSEVRCPTLFTWARRDRFIQLGRCRAAIERFPDARVQTFDAGHAPQLETPEAFAAAVAAFLDELTPARARVGDRG